MRKLYLLLMTLFVQLITVGSLFAADPPKEEYDAAMETIEDGTIYFITTEIEGETWYLKTDGNITTEFAEAGMFAVTKKTGGKLYDVGLRIDGGTGKYFSNTAQESNKAKLNPGSLQLTTLDRDDYERQVPFMNSEGKIAIRTCNIAYGESGWADCGRVFWTVDESSFTTCYSYDPDYRWSFGVVTEKDKIRFVMDAIYNKYEEQVWDEEEGGYTLNMGEGFGQRTDWDSWRELWNLLQVVNDVCQKFVDEDNPDYDPATDPDAPSTQAEAEEMKALADSLYQKILDSEVPYTVPDGYYRILAMNRYKSTYTSDPSGFVDKAIAASYDKNHANRVVFSTLDRSKAHFLWKFTKSESGDSILMQNAGMETYISLASVKQGKLVTTEDVNEATHVVFDYAYSDGPQTVYPDGIAAEKDIICIRPAQLPRAGGSSYFHQNGHGSVNDPNPNPTWYPWKNYGTDSGEEKEMAFWMRTWDWRDGNGNGRTSDLNASEWYIESVDAEEAEQLIADFEVIKNHDVLVARNNELRAQVLETLTLAKDVIRTKLITSASQMSSPYSHNDQAGNGKDGGDLSAGVLIDGDATTYWHSAWRNSPEGQHYIELTGMEDMVGDCEFYLREREGAANDRPKKFLLLGSDNLENADEDWVEITTIDIPNFAAGAESTVPFFVETAYPYVRVVGVDCDPSYRTFWHAAELQIFTVRDNPNSQFAQLGEVAETLEATYNANVATADEDITLEIYQALLDAYNTFISSGLVDPAELRAALATYAKATVGVVEGNNPGQWSNTEVPDAYDALYAEVDAYDKAGRYDAAQIHKYAVMLKAMQESIMESANKVETDKWYRIMFPTEEMYDEYGFGKDGGDKTSLREDQATLYGTFVTTAKEVSEQEIDYDDEGNEVTKTITHLEAISGEDSRESDRLFFMAEDEIDDKDYSIFRLVEAGETTADYGVLLTQMKGKMSMALELSAARGNALIKDVSQLSSNSLDRAEGNNLEYLIDGNISTYWHSDYHRDVLAPPYLQVAFDEPISGLIQVEMTRRQNATNGHIVRMYVQGSTDAENWDFMGYLETPFTNQNESVTSQVVNLSTPCKYLRFILTNRYGTDAGGNTEFDPFPEITSGDEYNKLWTYCHAAEFQIYSFTPAGELSSADEALLQAYMEVNKVLPKDATEEIFATASQAYEDFRTDFNTKEGKPVLPSGSSTKPVYALQNKATGLFVFVDGTGNQNNVYLKTIPSLVTWTAAGYQRSLLGVTNLKGESNYNFHAGETNRRFCTWNDYRPNSNSGLVICEADVDYEAPEEFTFYKNVKPGRIVDWCHSVSLTAVDAPDDASAYTVLGQYTEGEGEDAETYLALKALETIEAGQPALFIYGDTTSYDAEDDYVEPIKFKIPGDGELALKGTTENGFIGTLVAASYKSGIIYFNANYAKDVKNGYVVNVTPCSAVLDISLCPEVNPDEAYDFSIYLGQVAKDAATGVKDVTSAIEKISQRGNVYGMDGKLIRTGATLNDLKTLGTGMYILNGVKVMVK